MEIKNFNQYQDPIEVNSTMGGGEVASRTFVARVFSWMAFGLGITALMGYVFSHTSLQSIVYSAPGHLSGFGMFTVFAPFIIVLIMRFAFDKLSYPAILFSFITYAALTGMGMMSLIFLIYAESSIYSIFLITSAMFGVMAILGYTTSSDLTGFGSILRMLLIGAIIAMLVNFFIGSAAIQYGISLLCVAIFTGLTAYDTQMIKQMGSQVNIESGDATAGKLSILAALKLYLDFINLFLSLLQIFGRRR